MPNTFVKDAMLADPPSIEPHATMRSAAERLCAPNVTFLVVREIGSDPVGLLTDRDMTTLIAAGADPTTTPVREAISRRAVFCRDSDDLEDAAWLMERHEARRLIVLDDERQVVGVLSVDDIARGVTARLAGDVLRHTSSAR